VTRRISDALGERVVEAIKSMPVLAAAREQVDWEVTPTLMPDRAGDVLLAYMVAISVPVPGSVQGDRVLYMAPLEDPGASQEQVSAFVWKLYRDCQAESDARRREGVPGMNGHRASPGGLITP
jgi:hypothetical protein